MLVCYSKLSDCDNLENRKVNQRNHHFYSSTDLININSSLNPNKTLKVKHNWQVCVKSSGIRWSTVHPSRDLITNTVIQITPADLNTSSSHLLNLWQHGYTFITLTFLPRSALSLDSSKAGATEPSRPSRSCVISDREREREMLMKVWLVSEERCMEESTIDTRKVH